MTQLTNYVRKADICQSLNIGTTTLDRWVSEGKIVLPTPFKPTKRSTLYNTDDVNAAIAALAAET